FGQCAYAAAKEGIRGLSRVAATEWAKDGVNVNIICPLAWTAQLEGFANQYPEAFKANVKMPPAGHYGDAELEIGRVCVQLRKMEPADLDRLMEIWLAANLQAHSFVAADYWQSNLALVRQMLPQAEVYVYAEDSSQEILGFVGVDGDYIAGIFVDFRAR
ncbi:MAG: SDR family oxidoreductase, partial [Firmicutes bacterium]|nr:SDR family oxidoreductase [Bacillota bacterium]